MNSRSIIVIKAECKNTYEHVTGTTMQYQTWYYGAVTLNCITIVHLCLHRIDKHQERHLFLAVVALTIARLVLDIVFRHRHEQYITVLGFFLVLEFVLLDRVVRKMHKISSSPPIVVFCLTLCMLFADISYGLHITSVKTAALPV